MSPDNYTKQPGIVEPLELWSITHWGWTGVLHIKCVSVISHCGHTDHLLSLHHTIESQSRATLTYMNHFSFVTTSLGGSEAQQQWVDNHVYCLVPHISQSKTGSLAWRCFMKEAVCNSSSLIGPDGVQSCLSDLMFLRFYYFQALVNTFICLFFFIGRFWFELANIIQQRHKDCQSYTIGLDSKHDPQTVV